jgi:hypothetical protein
MSASAHSTSPSVGAPQATSSVAHDVIRALLGVGQALLIPERFFRASMPWQMSLAPVIVGAVARLWIGRLQTPFIFAALVAASPPDLAGWLLQRGPGVLQNSRWSRDLGGLIGVLAFVLFVSTMVFLILASSGFPVDFSAVLVPTAYASTALTLGRLFAQFLLQLRGEASMQSTWDLAPALGFGLVLREPPLLRVLVDNLNIFDAGFVVILAVGLMKCASAPKGNAWSAAGLAWLTCVAVQGLFLAFVALNH